MNTVYFALGSNLGDKLSNLQRALELIQSQIGDLGAVSQFVATKALLAQGDNVAQADYLNAACTAKTALTPHQILTEIAAIESILGRERKAEVKWQPRTIDIDLLGYADRIISEDNLKVPHPEMHKRNFVLAPLSEIAPEWRHPILGLTARELLEATL